MGGIRVQLSTMVSNQKNKEGFLLFDGLINVFSFQGWRQQVELTFEH
jgi:hypothetical protein